MNQMKRAQSHEKTISSAVKAIARGVLVTAIICLVATAYIYWLRKSTDDELPPLVMPRPYVYEEEQKIDAVLIWKEELLRSSVSGSMQLPNGSTIVKVGKGQVLASVLSRGRVQNLKSPRQGYFVPAWDGAEGTWTYPKIWPGSGILPVPPKLKWLQNLSELRNDRVIGKLLPLPQFVRAIFYADKTEALTKDLKHGFIELRTEPNAPKWKAEVRVSLLLTEQKIKLAVELPFFPPKLAESRAVKLLLCAGETHGLLVPESAVTLKSGTFGVYELIGDRITFRPVAGRPLGDGSFFISSGLNPGNPICQNAANAVERRVQLW